MIIFIFLTSGGQTGARPVDVLNVFTPDENNTFDLREMLENQKQDAEEPPVFQLQRSDDNDKNGWLERLGHPKPDVQESGLPAENASALQDFANGTQSTKNEITKNGSSDRDVSSARNARDASNGCIERYIYRFIYNYYFRIPICKAGCKSKYRIVNFPNGNTYAIRYDCYK